MTSAFLGELASVALGACVPSAIRTTHTSRFQRLEFLGNFQERIEVLRVTVLQRGDRYQEFREFDVFIFVLVILVEVSAARQGFKQVGEILWIHTSTNCLQQAGKFPAVQFFVAFGIQSREEIENTLPFGLG